MRVALRSRGTNGISPRRLRGARSILSSIPGLRYAPSWASFPASLREAYCSAHPSRNATRQAGLPPMNGAQYRKVDSHPIDPVRIQRHRIPTHFRKKRGNGWGTQTAISCRNYRRKNKNAQRVGHLKVLPVHCLPNSLRESVAGDDSSLFEKAAHERGRKCGTRQVILRPN